MPASVGCDLLKNSYLCLLNNTQPARYACAISLWFAEKFVSLLIEQHQYQEPLSLRLGCDLLKNSYLCLLNNTVALESPQVLVVVICWKIRIFAYWTTPRSRPPRKPSKLWFAEKFVSLLIEQHPCLLNTLQRYCCDLLKNSYLCLLNNTDRRRLRQAEGVVICWKIRIFAYWTTPQTTDVCSANELWFAEKFVSLLIEQHLIEFAPCSTSCCDLLKNSYLCLLNNTHWSGHNC